MPAPLRDVPIQAVDLIKSFEGIPDGDPSTVNIDPYLCPADVWTIGWGHAITEDGGQLKGAANRARAKALFPGGITRPQAETLLRGDLIPRAAALLRLARLTLNDGQFGALLSLMFNIGQTNLAASTLLRRLNQGNHAAAAEQFLLWDKARVKGVLTSLPGLLRRRKAERAMFLGEDWRAAGSLGLVTRGRSWFPEVLPVPEAPEGDRPRTRKKFTAPAKQAPATGSSTENAPTNKVQTKDAPAKEASAKNVSSKNVSSKNASAKEASAKTAQGRKVTAAEKAAPIKTAAATKKAAPDDAAISAARRTAKQPA